MRSDVASRGACRRGIINAYLILFMTVLIALSALMVDAGRLMLARSELQTAADSAARYAAMGMATSSTRSLTAYNQAIAAANEQKVDGRTPSLTGSNVQLGIWDSATQVFTATNDEAAANAVRVTVSQTLGGPDSARLFASILGGGTKTITASSIATATVISTTVNAPSMGNLWLAGTPNKTTITNLQGNPSRYDNSGTKKKPKQRPQVVLLSDLGLVPGDTVSFEGLSGQANNGAGASNTGPDGNTGWNVALGNASPSSAPNNSVNGISNVRAPISACMAVFLDDSPGSVAPASLDFGTAASRDYLQLNPELQQTFFVGDGKTSLGEVQRIKIPPGATRIYLGMMDAWQWNDNNGSFNLKFYRSTTVSTVH